MICASFVGMNNHAMNVMFGCGFLINEKIESFIWSFKTFLKPMLSKHPVTIMMDQTFSMVAAMEVVFPTTRHRFVVGTLLKIQGSILEILEEAKASLRFLIKR